jgi:hypothetical protein
VGLEAFSVFSAPMNQYVRLLDDIGRRRPVKLTARKVGRLLMLLAGFLLAAGLIHRRQCLCLFLRGISTCVRSARQQVGRT